MLYLFHCFEPVVVWRTFWVSQYIISYTGTGRQALYHFYKSKVDLCIKGKGSEGLRSLSLCARVFAWMGQGMGW